MYDHDAEPTPAFPLTVPKPFWLKVLNVTDKGFADSWLWGGALAGNKFIPRTWTGWKRLTETQAFMDLLEIEGIRLVEPPPYRGDPYWKILGYGEPAKKRERERA